MCGLLILTVTVSVSIVTDRFPPTFATNLMGYRKSLLIKLRIQGRDDYIWLKDFVSAIVYINKIGYIASNWLPLIIGHPIPKGVGAGREDIRFADINGDGKADYLWVHPADGSVDLWTNELGKNPAHLVRSTRKISTSVGYPDTFITFGILTDSGRADYIPVNSNTGQISPWLNGCTDPEVPHSGGAKKMKNILRAGE